jgi:hypothetical protein
MPLSQEGQRLEQKSLRAVTGKTAPEAIQWRTCHATKADF